MCTAHGGAAGCAVSRDALVGLDIESEERHMQGDPLRLARRFFSPAELAELEGAAPILRQSTARCTMVCPAACTAASWPQRRKLVIAHDCMDTSEIRTACQQEPFTVDRAVTPVAQSDS